MLYSAAVVVLLMSKAYSQTTCVDLVNSATGVSDCAADAYLCNNAVYYTLMTEQCPKTCGRCTATTAATASGTGATTAASATTAATCADLLNTSTGVSDCTAYAYLCTNAVYYDLMTQQCPKTCGRCTSSSTSTGTATASSTCVDLVNSATGVSDCTADAYLCNNAVYYTLMTQQCPKTCGRCTGK